MIRPRVVFRQSLTGANTDQNSDCNHDSMIADFTKAIALDPEDAWAIFYRGMAYEAKGKFDMALADYDKLIALKPNNANTYIVRGLAYADWGEDNRAIADFRRALEIDPSNQSAKNNLKAYADANSHHISCT